MTPTAPWMRSERACSRSAVWSSHLSYALCSTALLGLVAFSVLNSATPQGFAVSTVSSSADASRGHSFTTNRA